MRLLCRSSSQRRKKGKLRVAEIEPFSFEFAWAWLALAGRTAIPWLFTSFRYFEPPEHMPRTSTRAYTCTAVFTRASCVPRNREQERRPAGGRANNADVQKKFISYIVHISPSNIRTPKREMLPTIHQRTQVDDCYQFLATAITGGHSDQNPRLDLKTMYSHKFLHTILGSDFSVPSRVIDILS